MPFFALDSQGQSRDSIHYFESKKKFPHEFSVDIKTLDLNNANISLPDIMYSRMRKGKQSDGLLP